jgi:dephospho-CoA kinase
LRLGWRRTAKRAAGEQARHAVADIAVNRAGEPCRACRGASGTVRGGEARTKWAVVSVFVSNSKLDLIFWLENDESRRVTVARARSRMRSQVAWLAQTRVSCCVHRSRRAVVTSSRVPRAVFSAGPEKKQIPKKMLVLGLTGGIGMGKSFVTDVLRKCGVPVLDADAEVRVLYAFGGDAVAPIRALFGDDVIGSDGGVDRDALAKLVLGKGNETNMSRLESLVHPLVNQRREGFLHDTFRDRNALVVLDLPLLFEKGYENHVDLIVVVSAGEEKQRERCLRRPGMSPEKFENVKARQIADEVKKQKAHVVIDTGCDPADTTRAVTDLVEAIRNDDEGRFVARAYKS